MSVGGNSFQYTGFNQLQSLCAGVARHPAIGWTILRVYAVLYISIHRKEYVVYVKYSGTIICTLCISVSLKAVYIIVYIRLNNSVEAA